MTGSATSSSKDPKRSRAWAIAALPLAALLFAWFIDRYTPRTLVRLTFENGLDNDAAIGLAGGAYESEARFVPGKTGKALETLGEGGWIDLAPSRPRAFRGSMEISFDFKRADWVNPYRKGSSTQTMANLQGQTPKRIYHLSFNLNISRRSDPQLVVYVQDGDGVGHRLRAKDRPVDLGWHNVRVVFDQNESEVSLFLDGALADRIEVTPALHSAGLKSIRFGTWYKKNQAYRGLIDNFEVRDTGA